MFRLRTTVYLPCKVTRTLLGDGGRPAASRPLLPRTPSPALSPGPPHLSGQQEFPFFSLPQLHHVRQGLNRCTDTKKHTAFVMHGKETLPVSSPVPPSATRLPQTSLLLPLSQRRPPRGGEPRMQRQCPAGAPRVEELRAREHGADLGARPPH